MWILILLLVVSILVLFWQGSLLVATATGSPIVYADKQAIRACFKLAGLSTGQEIIDLGCGSARALIIATKEFGAKGIGTDRSLYSYFRSKINVWLSGQSRNIKIVWGDFRAVEKDLTKADLVYLYLLNETLAEIEPWLFTTIGRQTKVVSLAFSFPRHQPSKVSEVTNLGLKTKIRLYNK